MLAVVLQSLNTVLLGCSRPYMYTVIIKINLSRGRGHSLALLAGKDLALSRAREGRSQDAQQGGGLGRYHQGPRVYFRLGMCLEKPGMDLPSRKWTVDLKGKVAAVLTLLTVVFSPLDAYFFGWSWTFTGYFSSCHLRYI